MKREISITLASLALCFVLLIAPSLAQGTRGKAELKAGSGAITLDYGIVALKGRDMLSRLNVGDAWRMGANLVTSITTPVDLTFGTTQIAKGSYSLWLKKVAADSYELVFNTQTGQMGHEHDVTRDIAKTPLTLEKIGTSVENLLLELTPAAKGGKFSLSWGTAKLSADFTIGQ